MVMAGDRLLRLLAAALGARLRLCRQNCGRDSFPEVAVMISLDRLAVVGLVLALGISLVGCGNRSGGVVQESREFTFDEIAAAAAAETEESEDTAE
jgi:hypothetical protein